MSLFSIVGQSFALNRLQPFAERVYPEAPCVFRAEISTIDIIFSLRQQQEKCRQQKPPLYVAFIDVTKAFDLVSMKGLLMLLHKIGCPLKLLRLITSFHKEMEQEGHCTLQQLNPRPLSNQKWSKTGAVD